MTPAPEAPLDPVTSSPHVQELASVRDSRRGGRSVAIVAIGTVVVLALIAWLVVTWIPSPKKGQVTTDPGVLATGTPQAEADPGVQFTSWDGTFSMTLPSTWEDRTLDYRADYFDENHTVSALDGRLTLDGSSARDSQNFASMEAHTRAASGVSASDIGKEAVDRWRLALGEATELPEETFTTKEGDSVWMGGLSGTADGENREIVLAAVLGDESFVRFALEVSPEYYGARDALRQALATLVLSPNPAGDEQATIFAPSNDGRTSSSKGRASIVIPATWTHVVVEADREAFVSSSHFDSLGEWRIAHGDATPLPAASFVVTDKVYPIPSSVTEMKTRYPKVEGSEVDDAGTTYTTLEFGEWAARGDVHAGWVDVRVEYPPDVAAGREAIVTNRRCYLMVSNLRELSACIETLPGDLDAQAPAFEAALQTVKFDDEG